MNDIKNRLFESIEILEKKISKIDIYVKAKIITQNTVKRTLLKQLCKFTPFELINFSNLIMGELIFLILFLFL